MLLRRVIPCLDVDKGRVVKGVEFVNLRDAGDPVELAVRYQDEGADEIVFLDITASHEKRETVAQLARRCADDLFIPFTIGGGVRSVEDAQAVLDAGADKVSVNSAAVARPELLSELAEVFGAQSVVLAIDARREEQHAETHRSGAGRARALAQTDRSGAGRARALAQLIAPARAEPAPSRTTASTSTAAGRRLAATPSSGHARASSAARGRSS